MTERPGGGGDREYVRERPAGEVRAFAQSAKAKLKPYGLEQHKENTMRKKLVPRAVWGAAVLAVTALLCAACGNAAAPSGEENLMDFSELRAILAELPPNTADTPHPLTLPRFDFSDGIIWNMLLQTIGESGKYVALDLSASMGRGFAPASGKEYIVSLVLPEGLSSVGGFRGFPALREVTLPGSLVSIEGGAFADCPVLEKVSFPAATEQVDYAAFKNSPRVLFETRGAGPLSSPAYPGIDAGKLLVRNGVTLLLASPSLTGNVTLPANIAALGRYCFYEHTGITGITLPESITVIGDRSFQRCENLAAVTVGQAVTHIGMYAFADCTALTAFTFPPSVDVGHYAFDGAGLINVTVPPGARLGEQVFKSCSRLVSADIQTQNFGEHLFASSAVEHVTLPVNLAALPGGTFKNCYELSTVNSTTPGTVNLPATLVSLGNGSTFTSCLKIKTADMSGLTLIDVIPGGFMTSCRELETLTLPPNITRILGEGTFDFDEKLQSIVIPAGVTSIGAKAFYNAYQLMHVYIHAPVPPEIVHTNDAQRRKPSFYGNAPLLVIHVPAASLSAYQTAWADVASPDRFVAIE